MNVLTLIYPNHKNSKGAPIVKTITVRSTVIDGGSDFNLRQHAFNLVDSQLKSAIVQNWKNNIRRYSRQPSIWSANKLKTA